MAFLLAVPAFPPDGYAHSTSLFRIIPATARRPSELAERTRGAEASPPPRLPRAPEIPAWVAGPALVPEVLWRGPASAWAGQGVAPGSVGQPAALRLPRWSGTWRWPRPGGGAAANAGRVRLAPRSYAETGLRGSPPGASFQLSCPLCGSWGLRESLRQYPGFGSRWSPAACGPVSGRRRAPGSSFLARRNSAWCHGCLGIAPVRIRRRFLR